MAVEDEASQAFLQSIAQEFGPRYREKLQALGARISARKLSRIWALHKRSLNPPMALALVRCVLSQGVAATSSSLDPEFLRRAVGSLDTLTERINLPFLPKSLPAASLVPTSEEEEAEQLARARLMGIPAALVKLMRREGLKTRAQASEDQKRDHSQIKTASDARAVFSTPLWQSLGKPQETLEETREIARFFQGEELVWSFWRRWYQGFLDGEPLDWELQRRVALIPDADWQKGAAHIAGIIEEIEQEFLAERLPQAGRVVYREEVQGFGIDPLPLQNPALLGGLLGQVEDSLDDALANPSNGLSERSREARVIRRLIARHGNDPQRIEMDLVSVHAGLTRQIASEDLPPSEENLALQSACEQGAHGVRAAHPEIAENRAVLTEQAMREMSAADREAIEAAEPVLTAISDLDLAEDFREDIGELIADRGPPSGPVPPLGSAERNPVHAIYAEEARLFGRVVRIRMLMAKTPEIIDRISASTGFKAATIIVTLSALVTLALGLLAAL